MQKKRIVLICITLSLCFIQAISYGEVLSIQAHPLGNIKLCIDGRLDEPIWSDIDGISQFVQSEPRQGEAASEGIIVKLLTDGDNLYIGIHCRDLKPHQINSQLKSRDNAIGDRITVFLSGSGDNETGYLFRVNAAGVQADAFVDADGRNIDFSWNGIWYSAVNRDSTGWIAEFKIPFKTMRFSSGAEWKIGFARFIAYKNEFDYWPPIKVQQGLRISGLADLLYVTPSRPGLNLEVYPIGLIKYDRIAEKQYSANGGLNLSWSPTPAARLDFTGNPDFAQIESDPDRINLSRYETYFNEKRPFFIEGADKFKTPIQLSYTRRIGKRLPDGQEVPIYSAGKFMGSYGRYDVSILGAVCGKVDYTDWYGNKRTELQSIYPVIRIKRGIGNNSSLGVFYGAKENDSLYNRLYSVDGVWRTRELEWNSQIALSQNKEIKQGLAYKSTLNCDNRNFMVMASSERYDSKFSASGIGYVTYNGENHQIITGPVWIQKGIFQNLSILGGGAWSKLAYDPGYSKVGLICINPNFKKWGFSANVNYGSQYDMGEWYNNWQYTMNLWPNGERKWNVTPGIKYSSWSYNFRRGYFGPNGSVSIYTSYRLRSNVELAWQGNNTLEWKPDKSFEKSSWVHEFWYNWSLTRDLHFKIYYNPNWEKHYHKVNVLFSYNFAPKSWAYLAFNEGLDNSTGHLKTEERIITFKLSRLFWW